MRCHVAVGVRSSAFRNRVLSLAKTCSIGLRSGLYGGRKKELCADTPDCAAYSLALVAAEIIHDHDISGLSVETSACST